MERNKWCSLAGHTTSERARIRLERDRGPLFLANWDHVLMMHFALPQSPLQAAVPFELDLHDGVAWLTLVAFTMRHLRPACGTRSLSWLFRPIASHHFLNVRTYVRHGDDAGIHFLAEWVSNRLAVALGPRTFSLPYRYGSIDYQNDWTRGATLRGHVEDPATHAKLVYRCSIQAADSFTTCVPGSLDEWLMERYSAFNSARDHLRFFRVWHEPWKQRAPRVELSDTSLLRSNWPWFAHARYVGANYSPGVRRVWLGRPHRV